MDVLGGLASLPLPALRGALHLLLRGPAPPNFSRHCRPNGPLPAFSTWGSGFPGRIRKLGSSTSASGPLGASAPPPPAPPLLLPGAGLCLAGSCLLPRSGTLGFTPITSGLPQRPRGSSSKSTRPPAGAPWTPSSVVGFSLRGLPCPLLQPSFPSPSPLHHHAAPLSGPSGTDCWGPPILLQEGRMICLFAYFTLFTCVNIPAGSSCHDPPA